MFIDISHHGQTVRTGTACTGRWIFHLWGKCSVSIADNVTSNGCDVFINHGGRLEIGEDCMFANCFIHVGDNHAIFDVKTGDFLNVTSSPYVVFGKHVWSASRVTVMADTIIGDGSILGAGAILKGNIPPCSLVVGVPGRAVRTGVSWTRSANGHGWENVIERFGFDKFLPET